MSLRNVLFFCACGYFLAIALLRLNSVVGDDPSARYAEVSTRDIDAIIAFEGDVADAEDTDEYSAACDQHFRDGASPVLAATYKYCKASSELLGAMIRVNTGFVGCEEEADQACYLYEANRMQVAGERWLEASRQHEATLQSLHLNPACVDLLTHPASAAAVEEIVDALAAFGAAIEAGDVGGISKEAARFDAASERLVAPAPVRSAAVCSSAPASN